MCAKIGDKQANFNKLTQIFESVGNTDVVVLPEVWSIGWDCKRFQENAEFLESSETIAFLSHLAQDKNVNIIGGSFITKDLDNNFYNTCPVINRKGELVAFYNKNHLYSYYGSAEGLFVKNGACPIMVQLDGVKFGLTVCYDIRFPELYRAYRKSGADVFVNCAAWAATKPIPWEMMTRSRAIENQTYMVAVNQYGEMNNNELNLGHSRIIDYNGNVLSEMLEGEGVISATLDIKEMNEFRDKCAILNDIKESYEVKVYE